MAIFSVTNLFDSGLGSLRQAILDANLMAGADTIQFSGVSGTITLTTGQLDITDSLTINGLGANNIAVSGNNTSGVFAIENPNATIDVLIDGLTITQGNTLLGSELGGGIYNLENLILSNSTISNNISGFGGGLINYGTASIINSTFTGNTASFFGGGGIENIFGTTNIINSTISNNTASSIGGGFFSSGGLANISNSTISDNAADSGGGLFSSGVVNLTNTIIANSSNGSDCVTFGLDTNVNNLIEDGSCNPAFSGDPNLGPLQDNGGPTFTQALLPGSIAIDAGSNAAISPSILTDQRGAGFPRIINGTVDIGAYEASQNVPPVPEPSSLFGIITLGLVAIGSLRRRRK